MSGHYPFLIRGTQSLNFNLEDVTQIEIFSEENVMLYGLKNGEIFVVEINGAEQNTKLTPHLMLLPSFESSSGGVIAMTIAKMPFKLITVN